MNFSLMSWEFLTFSLTTGTLLALLLGPVRQAVFLASNLLFLWVLVGPETTLVTVGYLLLGYGLAVLIRGRPGWFWPGLVLYTALFVYLRQYTFLIWILPEGWLPQTLRFLGLSFLFFKVVHVLIETRSETLGEIDLPTYLNYCLNFTTLLSGPIQRYQEYRAQWTGEQSAIPLTFEAHLDAVLRILVGLVKVYVLADRLQLLTAPESSTVLSSSLGGFILNVYAYYFFLYFNFSGYCDIVIGIGSLLGIRPPENFQHPYLARNISDYWSRWHRSLTLWLTSYIFSPTYKAFLTSSWLGNRPLLSVNLALLLTMTLSGIWHGTTVNFLLWGIAHGVYLMIFRTWEVLMSQWLGKARMKAWQQSRLAAALGIGLTFHVVAFTLILFRFEAWQALAMLGSIPRLDLNDTTFLSTALMKLAEKL